MLKNVAKIAGLAAASYFLVSFRDIITSASDILVSANPTLLLASIIGMLGYRALNATGWGRIANALGGRIRLLDGAVVWLKSEAFRWLPGSVWGYCSRALMGQKLGLTKQQSSVSLSLELFLTLAAWTGTALVFSLATSSTLLSHSSLETVLAIGLAGFAGISLAIVVYSFSEKARRICHELIAIRNFKLKPWALIEVLTLYSILCLFNGFCFFLVCSSLGISSLTIGQAVAANSQAFLIGLFTFVAPGGLGVREGSLTAILSINTSLEIALAAALLWRLVQLSVELICLIFVFTSSAIKRGKGEFSRCESL